MPKEAFFSSSSDGDDCCSIFFANTGTVARLDKLSVFEARTRQ